jgi:nucleotide-binding universal stress UspA family protein
MDMKLILHPHDGSPSAYKALDYAIELAQVTKARLLVLNVQRRRGSDRIPESMVEFERIEQIRMTEAELLRAAAEAIARSAEQIAHDRGVNDTELLITEGDPAREIVETAKSRNVDAIIIGSRGLGDLEGLLLGSVSHKVAHLAPCTCVIVR